MSFMQRLRRRWHESDSLLCVGLDPEPERFPAHLRETPDAVFAFCRAIVDATADLVCAFKPQMAHFAALGAEDALTRLIAHIHRGHPGIPVVLDGKRGDIGSTARHYAVEAFDRHGADAATVNPYLGGDALAPFLERADKGVVVLCRTSNPGAGDFQDLFINGRPLFLHVAERVARDWNRHGNCALVVGATWPEQLARVRATVGDLPILVPGVGAQGGDVAAVLRAGLDSEGAGLLISSSRAVLHAGDGPDFAEAARAEASRLNRLIADGR